MKKGNNTISSIFKGSKPIEKIYKGTLVVYEAFKMLIASGVPPITLQKCKGVDDGKYLLDYKIYGNSLQDGTPTPDNPIEVESVGEKTPNMIDYSTFTDRIVTGITFTNNKDGSITANGTNTSTLATCNINSSIDLSSLEQGVEYYGSCGADKNDTDLRIYLFFTIRNESTGKARYFSSADVNSKKFTLSENEVASGLEIRINIPSGNPTLIDNVVFKPILCKFSDYVEYEPYGYKLPIKVSGKNILPLNDFSGTLNWNNFSIVHIKVEPNTRYFFRVQEANRSSGTGGISVYFYDNAELTSPLRTTGLILKDSNTLNTLVTTDINVGDYEDVYMMIRDISGGSSTVEIKGMSIIKEGVNSSYEPYKEPITTNIYLKEPLRKIGEYADYIDFENQKVIRNIYQQKLVLGNNYVTMTGDNWKRDGHSSFYIASTVLDVMGHDTTKPQLSNIFQGGVTGWEWGKCAFPGNYCLCGNSNRIFYFILQNEYLDGITDDSSNDEKIQAAKNFLNNTNIDVAYIRLEPTEEDIKLPNIPTHKGATIIEVDTDILPSNMEVEYIGKE